MELKDTDVAYFGEQYGKETVEKALEAGTLSELIKDANKLHASYKTEADFNAFKTNFKTDVETKYIADLEEKAKKGEIPQILYAPIKGAVLQQASREIGKRIGVNEYSDLNDLVDKAIQTSANGSVDETLKTQNEELKARNVELAKEAADALVSVQDEYKEKFLTKFKTDVVNSVPHDFSTVKSDELNTHKERTRKVLLSVFDADYKLDYNDKGQEVVLKNGELVKNQQTFDPVPVLDVFMNLAKEIGQKLTSPDTGGQGGSSSGKSTGSYESVEAFNADMKARGIKTTDPKHTEHWANSGLGNIIK